MVGFSSCDLLHDPVQGPYDPWVALYVEGATGWFRVGCGPRFPIDRGIGTGCLLFIVVCQQHYD